MSDLCKHCGADEQTGCYCFAQPHAESNEHIEHLPESKADALRAFALAIEAIERADLPNHWNTIEPHEH